MKHVLSIQDLSCLGRCSLTVALPVLSAMGCRCSVLPTTLLSTHTGFPKPYRKSLTEDVDRIGRHWEDLQVSFDAIGVGYLADPEQTMAVERVLETFPALTVVDPVMGDHGKLYSAITPDHIAAMKCLCRKGDVLLPNVTEAALLTGLPYREQTDESYLRELTDGMLSYGARAVVITGVSGRHGTVGFYGSDQDKVFSYTTSTVPVSSHGTGDLFAAVVLGGLMDGRSVEASARLAAGFVERVLQNTPAASAHGAEFETQLPWLMHQL